MTNGSFLSSPLEAPSGLHDSVTMPCSPWYARLSARLVYGLSWIWFTSGTRPVSSSTRCRWAGLKFDTPMARMSPASSSAASPCTAWT